MRSLNAAPVIHARLKNNDFPSGLLVAPEDFTQEDIRFCRKKITASTGYFEMAGEDGRRVFFCNERYAVIGASITIRRLFEKCGKKPDYVYVDGRRINYGFMGLVIPKSELGAHIAIDFPYQQILNAYEYYMDKLWDITTNFTSAERAPYRRLSFEESHMNISSIPGFERGKAAVIDENEISADELTACLMNQTRHLGEFSFCSGAPNVSFVQKGGTMQFRRCIRNPYGPAWKNVIMMALGEVHLPGNSQKQTG